MRRSIIFILLALFLTELSAQKKSPKETLTIGYQLVVDNDVFTLKLTQDQYYTSGIYPAVRLLRDSVFGAKVIRTYKLCQRMYTPSDVRWTKDYQMDRPYAGTLSLAVSNEYYFRSNQYLKVTADLGWMGPGSGVGKTQVNYHHMMGMPAPRGWGTQMNNSPLIDLGLTYIKPIFSSYNFEFTSETNASAGTVFNYVRQNLMVRFGELRPINKSAYTASSLGNMRPATKDNSVMEAYFFYSPGLEYVIYNATLEGNFIGKPSEFTVDAINWVVQHRAGMMLSWPRFDLGIIAYWRTHENQKAMNHSYVGIRMNQRF